MESGKLYELTQIWKLYVYVLDGDGDGPLLPGREPDGAPGKDTRLEPDADPDLDRARRGRTAAAAVSASAPDLTLKAKTGGPLPDSVLCVGETASPVLCSALGPYFFSQALPYFLISFTIVLMHSFSSKGLLFVEPESPVWSRHNKWC